MTTDEQNLTLLILTLLALFGFGYNWLVARIERQDPEHGYTAILVVAGCAITVLATVPLIGWRQAAIVFAAFAASGLVMVLGSMKRHLDRTARDRARGQADLQEATRGD